MSFLIYPAVCSLLYMTYVIGAELYMMRKGKDIWHWQEYLSGGTIAGLVVIASLL